MSIQATIEKHKKLVSQLSAKTEKIDNLADIMFQKTKNLIDEYIMCWRGNPIKVEIRKRVIFVKLWESELSFNFGHDSQEEDSEEKLSYYYNIETSQRGSSNGVFTQYDELEGWKVVYDDGETFDLEKNLEHRLMQIMSMFFEEAYCSCLESYTP